MFIQHKGDAMNIKKLICFWVACLIAGPFSAVGHYRPMIETGGPPLPPAVEPGKNAALVVVRVMDGATGKQTSATACVNDGSQEPDRDPYLQYSLRRSGNRLKGPIRFRPLKPYFYTDGRFEVRVPPGRVTLEVRKGCEYSPCTLSLDLAAWDTVHVEAVLDPWIDMPALGWYSGDTHIHVERTGGNDDTLLTLTSARGIRYAYLLSMNTQGYDRGRKYESWIQAPGLGDAGQAETGGYHLSSGQEYRTSTLGHVTIIMGRDYLPGLGPVEDTDLGPSLSVIADQTHSLEGFIGLAHGGYHKQEADGLLLAGKMDFLELLQFGGYRSLGLEGWYDFLNIGYRLPMVGACDYPYTRELGSEITYAWCEETPTPRQFAEALALGRSFATSGPMIFMSVGGHRPGEIVNLNQGVDTTLTVSVRVVSENYPVRYLELIVNGWVVARELADQPRKNWRLDHRLRVRESVWVAARAYADAGTEAHTNPVYLYAGDKLPFNRDSARQILARLDGSLETIENREVLSRLQALKKELTLLLDGRKSSLPLPSVQ
jgi:hypothetical protein